MNSGMKWQFSRIAILLGKGGKVKKKLTINKKEVQKKKDLQ